MTDAVIAEIDKLTDNGLAIIRFHAEVMKDKLASLTERQRSADFLAMRRWGKPADAGDAAPPPSPFAGMTTEQLIALATKK